MITKDELKEYAKTRGIKNIGHAEKDYFQYIILFILYQNHGKNIIFKGGTAMNKCFGLNRFSEDLDFNITEKIDFKKLENDIKRFKIEFEIDKKEYENTLKIIMRIKGPLYIGVRGSLCKLILDFSLRESTILNPEIKTIGRFLEEIPAFDIAVMQEKEILAEKIRTILTRNKARDVYDIWMLIKKNIEFDLDLTNQKLKFYNKKFNINEFKKKFEEKKNIWDSELKPLILNVPKFSLVKKDVFEYLKSIK